jgi:hypothetical protein
VTGAESRTKLNRDSNERTPMNHPWLVARHADEEIAAGWPLDNLVRLLNEKQPGKTVVIWRDGQIVAVRRPDGDVVRLHGDRTPAA